MGGQVQVDLPAGLLYLDAAGARRYLELYQGTPQGNELGMIANPELTWTAMFRLERAGHVLADEPTALDSAATLERIQRVAALTNRNRVRQGWHPVEIPHWILSPRYDAAQHRVEFAVATQFGKSSLSANYYVAELGRRGVLTADLATDSARLPEHLASFRRALDGVSFIEGYDYGSFRPGDRIAHYGLADLVAGGVLGVAGDSPWLTTPLADLERLPQPAPPFSGAGADWRWVVSALVAVSGLAAHLARRTTRLHTAARPWR